MGLHTVAFCCISTGIFGFPGDEAAAIAVGAVKGWLLEAGGCDMRVVFDVYLDRDLAIYRDVLHEHLIVRLRPPQGGAQPRQVRQGRARAGSLWRKGSRRDGGRNGRVRQVLPLRNFRRSARPRTDRYGNGGKQHDLAEHTHILPRLHRTMRDIIRR